MRLILSQSRQEPGGGRRPINALSPRAGTTLAAAAAALILAGAAIAGAAAAARPVAAAVSTGSFSTGFFDEVAFGPPASSERAWLARAVASGASVIRIPISWAGVAPSRPADPTNPADPAYSWTQLDSDVELATAAGLRPILSVNAAPMWAEGPGMPASATPGSWEPSASAFGAFATALARRYSGTYPDRQNPGSTLPAVEDYQAWNEPNLSLYLAPQWRKTASGYAPEGPVLYRAMLNAFYAGVKSVLPHAVVATAGTAPYGDPAGGQRMPPAQFVRTLLCVSVELSPLACPNPAHFDALAHHPYAIGSPYTPALDPDDVSIPDFSKLEKALAVAERTGRALPAGPKAIWATEVSYSSDPPNPKAVPMATFERWVAETLYELWSEHVSVVTWFLIEDQPPVPDYADSYQSGMYFLDGKPKPAQRAFRFPLVVDTRQRKHPLLWVRVPAGGKLVVQERVAGRWRDVLTRTVARYQTVERSLTPAQGVGTFRASVGGDASLAWTG
jgi:hypothetical protein